MTTEPSTYVLSLISAFCNDVQAFVQGGPRTATLVQKNRRTYAAYKRAIRSTAPPFMPYPSANEADAQSTRAVQNELDTSDAEDDEESEEGVASAADMSKVLYLQDVRRHIQR